MSDHRKQPKPNLLDKLEDRWRRITQKRSPAPSPQQSRSTTPAPFNRQGLALGETAILPSDAESAPKRVDNGEDALKGGDTTKTDEPDTVQSMPVRATYNVSVHGGTGGPGGQGGSQGGAGGTGEGNRFTIHHSNVNLTNPGATVIQSIEKKLTNHVAAQHKFTDQSKSLCAADTRVEIQADINRWLLPGSKNKEHIFWITGIAGSGKSTLSATVVENLREKNTPVAAQFFISRNIPETIDPAKIIPTIALQLAEFSPAAAGIIHGVLERGFPPTRKKQVEELLLAPIRELSKSRTAVIILIDALDELQDAAESVMEILSPIAPRDCNLPDNVRFLITSRPEHWADISRSKTLKLAVFKQRALEIGSSVYEVQNFIVARMKEITPSDWDDWPTRKQLEQLSGKANGLFHYAATAVQWIKQQIDQYGESCRSTVFKEFAQMGIEPLEELYKLILISLVNINKPVKHAAEDARRCKQLLYFQQVVGTILVLQKPFTIHQITVLLADIPKNDFDVCHFLQQMRSVLIPGTTTSFEEATPQMHKSFRDYIMDGAAPAEFCILAGHAHFVTARSCLEVIVKAGGQSDVVVKYSVQHWYKHLRKAVEGGMAQEDERMWNLFGEMVEKAVISIWAGTI
ncbi:hypothetical protein B0H14DRAFT_1632034 [Mycena olivaceomarginata]|nr:hypothetical protein B0H14DRAFT_1632034 [Mycena olivaceomarginata]